METIIKYKNRKLYNQTKSRYVSLSELVSKIKNDEPFHVIEHKTNVDITNKTLKQALINTKISNETITRILLGLI